MQIMIIIARTTNYITYFSYVCATVNFHLFILVQKQYGVMYRLIQTALCEYTENV